MTNLVIMLILLCGPWVLAKTWRGFGPSAEYTAAAYGASLLFAFTASGHFFKADEMVTMLPDWLPMQSAIVAITGVLEIFIAVGMIFRRTRRMTGIVACLVLIAFFPANIYAALTWADMGGEYGPAYLLVRTPVQVIIFIWILVFVVKAPDLARSTKT